MKYTPILMNSEMVRQTLADRKDQTRRVMRPQPVDIGGCMEWKGKYVFSSASPSHVCPYGTIGDRLIIKEASWMWCERRPNGTTPKGRQKWHYVPLKNGPIRYCADDPSKPQITLKHPKSTNTWMWKYKSARFMPRWAIRITLEITNIRVERVQDISEEDAMNEGVNWKDFAGLSRFTAKKLFQTLWDSINEKRGYGWKTNPYCWVVNFKHIKK